MSSPATYVLSPLPYSYDGLEPVISKEILEIHHGKHHQTYVNNLNIVNAQYTDAIQKGDLDTANALAGNLRFNYGGHVNHQFYWENLAPVAAGGGIPPNGDLLAQITADFGSFDQFVTKFNTIAAGVQGSGWGVLGLNRDLNKLQIVQAPNQEPFKTLPVIPILGIDVWEHAYYLQYKNVRAEYLKQIWKVVNWTKVSERFAAAKAGAKL